MEAQKRPENVILISGGAYLGPKSEKKCSPLSSIFDVVAPFQRYLPKSEILAKIRVLSLGRWESAKIAKILLLSRYL